MLENYRKFKTHRTLSLSDSELLVENGFRTVNDNAVMGGDQNLERRNVERPIFRNFKITNNKITKDELFDSFFF